MPLGRSCDYHLCLPVMNCSRGRAGRCEHFQPSAVSTATETGMGDRDSTWGKVTSELDLKEQHTMGYEDLHVHRGQQPDWVQKPNRSVQCRCCWRRGFDFGVHEGCTEGSGLAPVGSEVSPRGLTGLPLALNWRLQFSVQ